MGKIYMVTSGEYSDYGVDGLFTSKELAQQFVDAFAPSGYGGFNDIQEMPLDPHATEVRNGHKPFFVRMDKDGTSSECRIKDSAYGFDGEDKLGWDIQGGMYMHTFAKDQEHAVKIANEKRTQLIAANQWKGDDFRDAWNARRAK